MDIQPRQGYPQTGCRRLIGETVLTQRAYTFLQHVLRDLDALRGVELPQPFEELLVTVLGVQLPLHEQGPMPERVNHIHGQHHFVERMFLSGLCFSHSVESLRWLGADHAAAGGINGSALPSSTRRARRSLPWASSRILLNASVISS